MANKFFIGTFAKKLDDKNRTQLPREMQRVFKSVQPDNRGMYVLRGEEPGSLTLYTEDGFNALAERLPTDFLSDDEAKRFELEFYSSSHHVVADAQWRVVLPDPLVKKARLGGEVYLIGRRNRIEVFSPEMFEAVRQGSVNMKEWPEWANLNWSKFLRAPPVSAASAVGGARSSG